MPCGKSASIKPFRYLKTPDFQSRANKDDFKTGWRPIYQKMMEAPGLKIPADADEIDDAMLKSSFEHATKYLASEFSFLFENEKDNSTWVIGTWSRRIGRSWVTQHGNPADIAKLPKATKKNVKHLNRQSALPFKRRGVPKFSAVGSKKRLYSAVVEDELV